MYFRQELVIKTINSLALCMCFKTHVIDIVTFHKLQDIKGLCPQPLHRESDISGIPRECVSEYLICQSASPESKTFSITKHVEKEDTKVEYH